MIVPARTIDAQKITSTTLLQASELDVSLLHQVQTWSIAVRFAKSLIGHGRYDFGAPIILPIGHAHCG